MIGCDNQLCSIEWFHNNSLSRKPPHTFSVGDRVFAHNYHGTKV